MSEVENKVASEDFDGDASAEESAGEMTWPKPIFTKDGLLVAGNPRFLKKKRVHSSSFSHSGANGLTVNGMPSDGNTLTAAMHRVQVGTRIPFGKNSRKSRNGFRPSPKKRGGKKGWEEELDIEELQLDPEDPDYDSDINEPVNLTATNPVLSDEDFEDILTSLLREYYDHCKVDEIIDELRKINMSSLQRRRLPYLAVNLGLQHKLSQCELTSELLSELCGKLMSPENMQQGFRLILDELPDLYIDVPKAPEFIGRFIARAVADDILPPKFVQTCKETLSTSLPPLSSSVGGGSPFEHTTVRATLRSNSGGSAAISQTTTSSGISSTSDSLNAVSTTADGRTMSLAMQAIMTAEALLTVNNAYSRLDIVWGVHTGERVTRLLMRQIQQILNEYLDNNFLDDASHNLADLDAPHFHHELVYQAILMALERDAEDAPSRILLLLDHMCRSVLITLDQLVTGVKRVYAELPQLQADLPVAHILLERFIIKATEIGFMPKKLANELPNKARKRFVSEGDTIRNFGRGTYPV